MLIIALKDDKISLHICLLLRMLPWHIWVRLRVHLCVVSRWFNVQAQEEWLRVSAWVDGADMQ